MTNHSELEDKVKGLGKPDKRFAKYMIQAELNDLVILIAQAQREARLDELHLFSEAMTRGFIEPLDAKTFADYGLKRQSDLARYATGKGETDGK